MPSLLSVTEPGADTPPVETRTVLGLTVAGSSGELTRASMRTLTGTPVIPFAGLTTWTVGDELCVALPVVKDELKFASACPSISLIPVVGCTL